MVNRVKGKWNPVAAQLRSQAVHLNNIKLFRGKRNARKRCVAGIICKRSKTTELRIDVYRYDTGLVSYHNQVTLLGITKHNLLILFFPCDVNLGHLFASQICMLPWQPHQPLCVNLIPLFIHLGFSVHQDFALYSEIQRQLLWVQSSLWLLTYLCIYLFNYLNIRFSRLIFWSQKYRLCSFGPVSYCGVSHAHIQATLRDASPQCDGVWGIRRKM